MKTEDLINSYLEKHKGVSKDRKRDESEVKPKPVKPVARKAR